MRLKRSKNKNTRRKKRKVPKKKILVRKYLNFFGALLKVLVILGLVAAFLYLILFSSLFEIEKIIVEGTQTYVDPQDVLLIAETSAKGTNIFKFNKEGLADRLGKNLLGAKKYVISKEIPNKIRIKVYERSPVAVIYKDTDEYFLIDEDGYVLGYTDAHNNDLPKIRYEKDIKVGLFIDENLVPIYLELTNIINQEDIEVSSISFSSKHVNVYLKNDALVLIGNEKDKREALKAVKSLVREAEVEDKQIRRIDFRYDKVIVLFK